MQIVHVASEHFTALATGVNPTSALMAFQESLLMTGPAIIQCCTPGRLPIDAEILKVEQIDPNTLTGAELDALGPQSDSTPDLKPPRYGRHILQRVEVKVFNW
ncbi:hypothetical protein [Ferrimonas marina]|uniref:Uncharacterized protein n=1 Tax=Ferrimonas marina TaxID=299255 RepID=A0A1M5UGC1_9GAMM|nr:hypothetical protein [Ferrimonas marina]SHH61968.1 hypothetical protein SAMN02745129_2555 [Ferrimonas marina]